MDRKFNRILRKIGPRVQMETGLIPKLERHGPIQQVKSKMVRREIGLSVQMEAGLISKLEKHGPVIMP